MIKKIRDILQSGICLSDFTDKCKNAGACRKCEDEALEKLIAEHDKQIRTDTIEGFRELITKRLRKECNFNYCDDKEECCEVDALMWLDKQLEQLKEQK